MARLDIGVISSSPKWTIPWKVVGALALVGGIWGFIWHEYRQFHPAPSSLAPAPPKAVAKRPDGLPAYVDKLGLSGEQQKKIAAAAAATTSPAVVRREFQKILTPAQQKQFADLRAEEQAARRLQKQKAEARRARLLPGGDAAAAKSGDEAIRLQREARAKAAAAATQAAQK